MEAVQYRPKKHSNMSDHSFPPLNEEDLQIMIEDIVPSSTKDKEKWTKNCLKDGYKKSE